jgi:hypothetical protein
MLTGMAREESDREDLLREATALVERIELAPAEAGSGEHVVIGFRADGSMSVYFGGDPAYHFNSSGQLRRAYCDGLLYKAERGKLVSLERIRQQNEVQLVRRPLPDSEESEFLATMLRRLRTLAEQCRQNELISVGQVPAEADVLGRALGWLDRVQGVTIAISPHAR